METSPAGLASPTLQATSAKPVYTDRFEVPMTKELNGVRISGKHVDYHCPQNNVLWTYREGTYGGKMGPWKDPFKQYPPSDEEWDYLEFKILPNSQVSTATLIVKGYPYKSQVQ